MNKNNDQTRSVTARVCALTISLHARCMLHARGNWECDPRRTVKPVAPLVHTTDGLEGAGVGANAEVQAMDSAHHLLCVGEVT